MGRAVDWDEVVEDLGPRLYRYFCVRFSREQADDLTQDTLIRLMKKVEDGSFNPDKGTLKMLGFGIAHYVGLEAKRGHAHESIEDWKDSLDSGDNLEELTLTRDATLKVRDRMKLLSGVEQQVLALMVDEDLTLKEISMILQMSEGTVKSHTFRAKQKLIKMIHEESLI